MSTVSTVLIITVIAITGVALGSYYYVAERPASVATLPTTSTLPASPTAEPTVTPSPITTPEPSMAPVTTQFQSTARVQGTQHVASSLSTKPTPTPTPTPRFTSPSPAAASVPDGYAIEFLDLPATISAGESFTVRWRVNGPAGGHGEKTTLKLSYENSSSSGNSESSVSTNSSNSFGSFVVGQVFSSKFSFGNDPGTINVTITADIDGRTITSTRHIQLVT